MDDKLKELINRSSAYSPSLYTFDYEYDGMSTVFKNIKDNFTMLESRIGELENLVRELTTYIAESIENTNAFSLLAKDQLMD